MLSVEQIRIRSFNQIECGVLIVQFGMFAEYKVSHAE